MCESVCESVLASIQRMKTSLSDALILIHISIEMTLSDRADRHCDTV